MNDAEHRLMRLAPYRAISKGLVTHTVDGKEFVTMSQDDFKDLLRHFLSIIPIDERAYLKTDPILAEGISSGRFHFTPTEHFVRHGYLEGRRPLPEYLPEDYDFRAAIRTHPPGYYTAMFKAAKALAEFDYTAAERNLRKALASFPESYQANRSLGILLSQTGRPFQAYFFLNAAIERHDGDREIRLRLASVCQALFLPDERAGHLRRAFELAGNEIVSQAAALADAMGDLGHIKDSHQIFVALGSLVRGGYEIASQQAFARAFVNHRESLRALIRKSRTVTLPIEHQIDLADRLARLGFPKAANRRINTILAGLRDGSRQLSGDSYIRLLEAIRLSRGLDAAVGAIDLPHASDPRTINHTVDLLYRSQNFARIAHLQSEGIVSGGSELTLRCLVLSAIHSRDFEAALSLCRTWMTRFQESSQWAAMVLLTLSEKGEISFVRVPKGANSLPESTTLTSPIPRRIAQFWNDDEPPSDVRATMDSWAANNPSFEYRRFSDKTGRVFIQSHFDAAAVEAYDFCQHAAMRGDYFRIAYLAIMGGVFIDADEHNTLPLSVGLAGCGERSLMLVCNDRLVFFASPIAAVARHPLVVAMFEAARDSLLTGKREGRKLDSWQATGPGVITRIAAERLLVSETQRASLLSGIAIMNASDSARISQEGSFEYKKNPARNWRMQNA